MKKKLALLLAAMLVLSLALYGCSGSSDSTGDADTVDSAVEGDDSAAEGEEEEELFFDPSLLGVKAIDDKTLEVELVADTPYFLELTAFPTYMPVNTGVVNENGDAWAVEPETYVGNGPYRMTEFVPSSHITMEKNPEYWEVDKLGPETIKFHLIEDNVAQLNAFQAGELSFIDMPPQSEAATLRQEPTYHAPAQMGTYYISFNNEVEPFNDPLVRQAFSLAIDRVLMAEEIGKGDFIPAGAWVAPNIRDVDAATDFRDMGRDYYDPRATDANMEQAKAILAEAGYPDGEGLPVITYIYNDDTLHSGIAEALQDMWGQLGATVELEMQEWSTFINSRQNGEYMVARHGWLSDYNDPISMLDLFKTGAGNNNGRYSNTDYDALIDGSKNTSDQAQRYQMMHEAEEILMNDWAFAPVMYYGDPFMMDTSLDSSCWASSLGFKYFMYAEGHENLEVCLGPNPATIDPALNTAVDGGSYAIHAFEGLYRLDKDGATEPACAESVDVSDDGLTYTFHLRDGLKFSNGDPLTAQDFVDSWVRAIDPATAAEYSYMFACIKGYDAALGVAEEAAEEDDASSTADEADASAASDASAADDASASESASQADASASAAPASEAASSEAGDASASESASASEAA